MTRTLVMILKGALRVAAIAAFLASPRALAQIQVEIFPPPRLSPQARPCTTRATRHTGGEINGTTGTDGTGAPTMKSQPIFTSTADAMSLRGITTSPPMEAAPTRKSNTSRGTSTRAATTTRSTTRPRWCNSGKSVNRTPGMNVDLQSGCSAEDVTTTLGPRRKHEDQHEESGEGQV